MESNVKFECNPMEMFSQFSTMCISPGVWILDFGCSHSLVRVVYVQRTQKILNFHALIGSRGYADFVTRWSIKNYTHGEIPLLKGKM